MWHKHTIEDYLVKKRHALGDFPGSPVVRATHFHCRGNQGWILGQRTKICLVTQSKKKEKQELLIHAATWINLTK